MLRAVLFSSVRTVYWLTGRVLESAAVCAISATTAAACGAAAEVPKKREQLALTNWPKKLVQPPSVAVKSGWWMTSGLMAAAGTKLVTGPKYRVAGPRELKSS